MISVYGKGPSCKALARALDGIWHSSETNRVYKWYPPRPYRRRPLWSRPRGGVNCSHVVNYGFEGHHRYDQGVRPSLVLNSNIVHDKLSQLRVFRRLELAPEFSTDAPRESGWLARARSHRRGTDIRMGTQNSTRTEWRRIDMPENTRCAQCHAALHLETAYQTRPEVSYPAADYYVKYIPKEREFRVHVIRGVSVRICEKIPMHRSAIVWNSENSHFSFAVVEPREVRRAIRDAAKQAVEALNMDFGAVDLMWHRGQVYLLEVNSAPSLTDNESTLNRYVDHIKEWANGVR